MNSNETLAIQVISELLKVDVDTFCVCAGARNAPILSVLENTSQIHLLNFFEERSAAFFAYGRALATRKPVVIVTTSGTAVAETLPSVIESYYSEVPLIILSADRPRSYRGTASPQTIEQVGILSHYLENSFDIDEKSFQLDLSKWKRQGPLHVNVSFDEPLLSGVVPEVPLEPKYPQPVRTFPEASLAVIPLDKPFVIVGPTRESERDTLAQFLKSFPAPQYCETLSGLRSNAIELPNRILYGEKLFEEFLTTGKIASVLRLGGVPTSRIWRDLEKKYPHLPVLSISDSGYSGLSRGSVSIQDYKNLAEIKTKAHSDLESLVQRDKEIQWHVEKLFEHFPESEVALMRALQTGAKEVNLYLGNSLPVREADLLPPFSAAYRSLGNRGANGIDGQISSFLGWCSGLPHDEKVNLGIFGDLTTLYDLAALWATGFVKHPLTAIAVINNFGGQIFRQVNQKDFFLNSHRLQFGPWAQMWGWKHQLIQKSSDLKNFANQTVYEIQPDPEQSQLFTEAYKKLS